MKRVWKTKGTQFLDLIRATQFRKKMYELRKLCRAYCVLGSTLFITVPDLTRHTHYPQDSGSNVPGSSCDRHGANVGKIPHAFGQGPTRSFPNTIHRCSYVSLILRAVQQKTPKQQI